MTHPDIDAAGTCVHCKLPLVDDGIVLIDSTGGDACGMPLDDGNSDHGHCRGFASDTWGDDPNVCIECFVHADLHPGNIPAN